MRKTASFLVTFCLLVGSAVATHAEGEKPMNEAMLLFADGGFGSAKVYLTDKFSITSAYEDELLKAGFRYQPSDHFGIKVGEVYNHDSEDTFTYGGIDFIIPFGNNLNLVGYYDANYKCEDWNRYEVTVKVQMFKNHFVYAGVRGDNGDSVPEMEYNEERHEGPHLFLKGDFSWYWKKVSISLNPVLFVKGYYYHDYTFKYHLKENTDIVLNINNLYNTTGQDTNFRAGLGYKF